MGISTSSIRNDRHCRWLGVVFAAMATGACNDAEAKDCTAMGCSSGATVFAVAEASFSDIAESTLEVCRNESCMTAKFSDVTEETVEHEVLPLGDAKGTSATARFSKMTAGYRLDIAYTHDAPTDLVDGDRYRVRLMAASGEYLVDVSDRAEYEDYYPNGQKCDTEPCRQTSLAF